MFGRSKDPDPAPRDSTRARLAMVENQLRARGIRDERVLDVMASVPREHFVPPGRRAGAYDDRALPLAEGQTISQPYMVAVMTEALRPEPTDRVLEVGTGSGYQTAVLARLVAEVYSVERISALAETARERLDALGVDNVEVRVGDGTLGWADHAPYDGILVTAGAPDPPPALERQLADGGRLVVPEGDQTLQKLVRYTSEGDELVSETLLSCRFVPLVGEYGWQG